jgi:hypothetical protein
LGYRTSVLNEKGVIKISSLIKMPEPIYIIKDGVITLNPNPVVKEY